MVRYRFIYQFGLTMLAYLLSVVVSSQLLTTPHGAFLSIALALLPVPFLCLMATAVVRQLRRMDELGQRIQLEALGLAFVGSALITFSYGFLETAGFPRLSMFYVWPLMGSLWALGCVLGVRRYR
ncbi:hypothetical protein SAMN05216271_2405 [Halopseudomonas sabulinigri]|uniref:Uncharacterized protein n=1 Tax=Halopseudomonas sabulinigri TaxID=472181 RepID=A0A1H1TZ96_9GAMM|nr:hypothetical protein [Halopseudomonas sabulinigri]SDS65548.1 hypothetical protein SAMN05216271_2405 [Halopseudomonas sabulinigri]